MGNHSSTQRTFLHNPTRRTRSFRDPAGIIIAGDWALTSRPVYYQAINRSVDVQRSFGTLGVDRLSRLMYVPQPLVAPQDDALRDLNSLARTSYDSSVDMSFVLLMSGVRHALYRLLNDSDIDANITCLMSRLESSDNHGVHFLTYLDVYAALPSSHTSSDVVDRVEAVTSLLNAFQASWLSQWTDNAVDLGDRLHNCIFYHVLERLILYNCRAQGHSMSQVTAELTGLHESATTLLPSSWTIVTELMNIHTRLHMEMNRVENLFNQEVQLQWACPLIPVCLFTTPVTSSTTTVCAICCDIVTSPGVLTSPCGHAYCKECLESWVYACQPNSHTCPACRTSLFAKPTYEPEESETLSNYQQELDDLNDLHDTWSFTMLSRDVFNDEQLLQEQFEAEADSLRHEYLTDVDEPDPPYTMSPDVE